MLIPCACCQAPCRGTKRKVVLCGAAECATKMSPVPVTSELRGLEPTRSAVNRRLWGYLLPEHKRPRVYACNMAAFLDDLDAFHAELRKAEDERLWDAQMTRHLMDAARCIPKYRQLVHFWGLNHRSEESWDVMVRMRKEGFRKMRVAPWNACYFENMPQELTFSDVPKVVERLLGCYLFEKEVGHFVKTYAPNNAWYAGFCNSQIPYMLRPGDLVRPVRDVARSVLDRTLNVHTGLRWPWCRAPWTTENHLMEGRPGFLERVRLVLLCLHRHNFREDIKMSVVNCMVK